ncbi:molecular chaperone GrpE [Evansella vedderi]|uniref:Protein GrpE n=1 Tax=Evansella vedderi TaxID=38282 RepID=A0ABT9ZSX5_9BACI|nr:molecular chaperone GrpE [Evansella vedderi]
MDKKNSTAQEEVVEKMEQTVEPEASETEAADELVENGPVEEAHETKEESDPVNELEQKLEETTNRLLRVQADYDNFRRRTRLEKEADAKYRSQQLAEELLPALDNFERALMITPEAEETKNLLKGMEMVYRQIKDALNREGIEVIETVGQVFDPHVHQAVMQVETDEYEKNVVVEELQKGYKLKDRVIRPAMVKVNS